MGGGPRSKPGLDTLSIKLQLARLDLDLQEERARDSSQTALPPALPRDQLTRQTVLMLGCLFGRASTIKDSSKSNLESCEVTCHI